MRILILSQWFQPEPFLKGLPLATALRDRGHDVEVLTGFPNYPGGRLYHGYQIRPWKRESINGIRVNRVPLYPSHDLSGARRILNYLSFGVSASVLGPWLVQRSDVVFVYNLITLIMAARMLHLFRGCRIVLDVQDLWPESVTSSGMLRNRLALAILERWCRNEYRTPHRLIVLSPGFKTQLVARGVDPVKIEVIYNWCDEASIQLPSPSRDAAAQLGFDGRFNVVFAGTMGTVQALDAVIAAARRIEQAAPDVLFTLVGGGVEVDRLRESAAGLRNVQFLPQRPRSQIGQVLVNADALLVHLKRDPLFAVTIPSKIQAYLYAGRPILCGVPGDAATLVQAAGAGVAFEPENPDSLAQSVMELRNMSRSQREAIGVAGRRFYDEQLSLRCGTERVEGVLRSVVEAR